MAEKFSYLRATETETYEQNPVNPVIIWQLLELHNPLVQGNSHDLGIFNLKRVHHKTSFLLQKEYQEKTLCGAIYGQIYNSVDQTLKTRK